MKYHVNAKRPDIRLFAVIVRLREKQIAARPATLRRGALRPVLAVAFGLREGPAPDPEAAQVREASAPRADAAPRRPAPSPTPVAGDAQHALTYHPVPRRRLLCVATYA
jgi:hypothetical protein